MSDHFLFCMLWVFFMVGALIGIFAGHQMRERTWEHQAIERGYALHCPDTGDFAWKGECGE